MDLVLGRDAGDDADAVDLASHASSSPIAANSAPVIARPVMPSWRAIASAVTAWSPVIIRTWMPAAWAIAMAAFASARGGSTMPTRASSVRSVDQRQQVGRAGSNVAGSKSR